ncbi:hypothetical protein [Arcticibacterium luteifluviistationis]|uniref:Glycosyltransferase RgtA/B/C/D-like domain-containing protein n=1 Tax=Arcticibacterium luteifluviistationis TaxID=1784714 RepID=A0A2Z4GCV1_9BACT|nr:hypothetical protein [Arcticibacterium luteifluviistationis]AWV99129.1 hypothetical protein DJ013_13515 [Arcticibacterium luteifluviistationis]
MLYILNVLPVLNTELEWMLIGERLNSDKSLYSEIWTNTGPLSSYFYGLVHFLLGRGQFYQEIVAFCILFVQTILFTLVVNNNKAYAERNYLPGLFYAVAVSLSFDANKLSPALLATTFLLLAINSIFRHIDNNDGSSEPVFEMGLFLGIGSLFWYPFPVFLVWALLSLIMFTPVKFNQILLLVLGFVLPAFITILFFYLTGSFDEFYAFWIQKGISLEFFKRIEVFEVLLVYGLPILLSIFGMFKVFTNSRYSNFQNRKQQIIVLSGIFALVAFFFSDNLATYQLLSLSPFLAFFMAGYFLHIKGTAFPEILFLIFLGLVLTINNFGVSPFIGKGYSHLEDMRIEKETEKSYIKGRSILITGPKNGDYFLAKSGSAYLNWNVSKFDLTNADIYESLINIDAVFQKEMPEFIIDNEQVFPKIFRRIPALSQRYERVEGTRNFRLKD